MSDTGTGELTDAERESDIAYVRALGRMLRRCIIGVTLTLTTYIVLVGAVPMTVIIPVTILLSLLALDATATIRSNDRTKQGIR